ncbi:response regulator [Flavisolibacter ginsenosidimutans]|uniref:Response regulator n=1 Tax=Flavisolibacter ginsenosidimutans TaxID=661481 RepID=A0A5B8UNB4_9BACT|nr:response regulator [Flavisolibacter ginsenosidimutans]QEC58068.1 response regulator [Flavisolibacter ginsenosidimutans]
MKTYRIIIVENDEDEQFFMKEGFDAAGGFQIVAQLKSGDDLFEWLNEHKDNLPDVILSDLNMPGKNGYDIIEEQKKTGWWSKVPVIITSTSSTKSIMDRCLAQGAAAYIVKPDTFVEYVPYVRNLYKQMEEEKN